IWFRLGAWTLLPITPHSSRSGRPSDGSHDLHDVPSARWQGEGAGHMTVPTSGGSIYAANGHDPASEMLWTAQEPGLTGGRPDERDQASRGVWAAHGPSALRLVWLYPDLLSTYGDRGNLIMLARRARLRGLAVEPIQVNSDRPVPREGDIYLL